LRLDPAVWQSMLAVVDTDENGVVEWEELVQFMCDVFKHIERDKLVRNAIASSSGEVGGTPIGDTTNVSMETGEQQAALLTDVMTREHAASFGVARTSLSVQRNDPDLESAALAAMMPNNPHTAEVEATDADPSCDRGAAS